MNRFELSRRALLRSIGAGAVPLLSTLMALGQNAPKRLLIIHQTGGCNGSTFFPSAAGDLLGQKLPRSTAPLEPWKRYVTILDGVSLRNFTDYPGHGAGHENYAMTYTGNKGVVIQDGGPRFLGGGPTPDQVVAEDLAKKNATTVRSMHLAAQVDDHQGRDFFRRAFWRGPGRAVTPEHDPMRAAALLMGGKPPAGISPEKLAAERKTLLDYVGRDLKAFAARVGTEDRAKIEGHMDALQSLQKQLTNLVKPAATVSCKPVNRSIAIKDPLKYKDIVETHMDIVAAAFACDVTRVATLQLNDGAGTFTVFPDLPLSRTNTTFKETNSLGLRNFHDIQHGGGEDKILVNAWYMERLAGMIKRLSEIPEGSGRSVLDNTVILHGNHMGNGGAHDSNRLPWVMAGSCGGYFRTGHVVKKSMPTNAVLTALCNAMGVPSKFFGDEKYGGEAPSFARVDGTQACGAYTARDVLSARPWLHRVALARDPGVRS